MLLFQGSESVALATGASEVDDVGLRPVCENKVSRSKRDKGFTT